MYFCVNATGDTAAGRHALEAAIDAAGILGVEQGGGEDGALTEWSWPGLTDHHDHWPVHHLYAV